MIRNNLIYVFLQALQSAQAALQTPPRSSARPTPKAHSSTAIPGRPTPQAHSSTAIPGNLTPQVTSRTVIQCTTPQQVSIILPGDVSTPASPFLAPVVLSTPHTPPTPPFLFDVRGGSGSSNDVSTFKILWYSKIKSYTFKFVISTSPSNLKVFVVVNKKLKKIISIIICNCELTQN
jgi:hypothetical protein